MMMSTSHEQLTELDSVLINMLSASYGEAVACMLLVAYSTANAEPIPQNVREYCLQQLSHSFDDKVQQQIATILCAALHNPRPIQKELLTVYQLEYLMHQHKLIP